MSTTAYAHIETNTDGVAIVSGTTTKVVEVVLDHLAHHWHADEIQRQHPHLHLAQIHAALAYYYDHQAAMDSEISDRLDRVAEIKNRRGGTTVREKLRSAVEKP